MMGDLRAYLAPCGRVMEELAPEQLVGILQLMKVTVVAECRPEGGEAVCHFQALVAQD